MTDDFVTRLQLQLREAATREQARSPWLRLGDALRGRIAVRAVTRAVATAAMIVLAVGLLLEFGGGERVPPPKPTAPRVLATVAIGENPNALVGAFGAAWIFDRADGMLLRVDPATRKVTARLAAGHDVSVGAGRDAVYATEFGSGTVMRIDPATAHATAHRRLGVGSAALPLTDGGRLWVAGVDGATRLDPVTLAPRATIALHGGFKATGSALVGDDLWALQADGRLHHFDAANGAPKALGDAPQGLSTIFSGGGAMFAIAPRRFLRLDPRSGRVLWRSTLAGEVGATTVHDAVVWAHVSDPAHGGDRLVGLDVRTGRPVGTTRVNAFGSVGLAAVGDQLWLTTPGGQVVIMGW